jgi:hypothetical protein
MKQLLIISSLFFTAAASAQKLNWIPFNWQGDSVAGRFFDKLAITIPVTLDSLPHKFNMQLDLGATTTVIYGNSIAPYLDKYNDLKSKTDTTLTFWIQSQKNFKFKNVALKLGSVSFGNIDIGLFKNFGDSISTDSANTISEKHIGTIAPDIFQNKVLIIDYPNKRICVTDQLPKQFAAANFQPYKIKNGRIKIPFTINNKQEDLLFDTGSSLFSLMTTEQRAKQIAGEKITDSIKISSWGEFYMVYGKQVNSVIKFGGKQLNPATVFYDKLSNSDTFYEEEKIWGITGNAYFLNNIVIIDYSTKRFGIK